MLKHNNYTLSSAALLESTSSREELLHTCDTRLLPNLIRCPCAAVSRFVVSFHLCLSLCFSFFLSHYFPLVPSKPISLVSAIPLYLDTEAGDLAFLLSLPIIDSNCIYRLKDVVNVGFWQGNTYVKIHTPEVVAYHDNNEQLYLAPNLRMCTRIKDINFLCPSKPFVRDNTEGICGLESIRPDNSCPAEATPHSQVEVTQAEIIGNRWLVNTPARTATLTYDQHDTGHTHYPAQPNFMDHCP